MSNQPYTTTTPDVDLRHRKALEQLRMETRAAVERAGIVLVPDDGFRNYPGPVFPQGTVDFLQFLRDQVPSGTTVEIAAEDAGYKEVALHFDIVRLATLVVEYLAAPAAAALIAAYLKDQLGGRFKTAEARAAIVVHRKDGALDETVRISYEGPATNVEPALRDEIASLAKPTGAPGIPTRGATQPARPTLPKQLGSGGSKKKRKRRQ